MTVHALHTVLRFGREADYDALHATIPADLDRALRDAGITSWTIWRDGVHVFHLVECDDFPAARERLRTDPANVAWQRRVGDLFELADDYGGNANGLALVWRLP